MCQNGIIWVGMEYWRWRQGFKSQNAEQNFPHILWLCLQPTRHILTHFATEEKYKYKNTVEPTENRKIWIFPDPSDCYLRGNPFGTSVPPFALSSVHCSVQHGTGRGWEGTVIQIGLLLPTPIPIYLGSMMVNAILLLLYHNAVESSSVILPRPRFSPRWVEPHIMADGRGREGRGSKKAAKLSLAEKEERFSVLDWQSFISSVWILQWCWTLHSCCLPMMSFEWNYCSHYHNPLLCPLSFGTILHF